MEHNLFMHRCLDLARLGLGFTAMNPLVGAVIVHKGQVIGEGYHERYGGSHAEVNAVNSVNDLALLVDSTLYVNLEPCSHHGKTPPCADLIVKHKIPRVVFGMVDPDPRVSGRGLSKLREAGVQVIGPILEEDCKRLNQRFLCHVKYQRPWILLKWATSCDGFMDIERRQDEKGSMPISGNLAQSYVHQWRTQEAAILIGVQTAINDNPMLNVRFADGPQPLRIIIDPNRRLPKDLSMFTDGLPLLIVQVGDPSQSDNTYMYLPAPFGLKRLLEQLYLIGIASVLVEGGQKTLTAFLKENLWDEARVFVSPTSLKNGLLAPEIKSGLFASQLVGQDVLHYYRPSQI